MTIAVGRAQLALLIERLGLEQAQAAAAFLGYERAPEAPKAKRAVSDKPTQPAAQPPPQPGVERDDAPVPFLRLEGMEFVEPAEAERPKGEGLSARDITSPGVSLFAYPATPPLAPWSRLWPVVRGLIQRSCESRAPDIPAVVRSIGRGVVPRHLPRLVRSTWPASLAVWLDRSERLTPVWDDQLDVLERVSKVCGPSAVKLRVLDVGERSACLRRHGDLTDGRPGDGQTTVLALSDLGFHGSAKEREAWQATARRLEANGTPFAALVPARKARWTKSTARKWKAAPWEQRRLAPSAAGSEGTPQNGKDELLKLLSMALLVQPGLLRTIRRLLPAAFADISTELDVWQSDVLVQDADSTGLMLRSEVAETLRERLRDEVLAGKVGRLKELRDAIHGWHKPLPAELLHAEALVWKGTVPSEVAAPPGSWEATCSYLQKLATSIQRGEHAAPLMGFGQSVLPNLPQRIYNDAGVRKGLVALLAVASDRLPDLPIPAGVEPYELAAVLGETGQEQWWSIRQVGKNLVFRRSTSRWPSEDKGPGSPVAWLLTAGRKVFVGAAQERCTPLLLRDGQSLPWNGTDDLWIVSDRSKLHLAVSYREPWMQALGRDRYGVYADADIKGVVQRFRWIPPGRSWIGSPENEEGRFDWEYKRFHVTWTRGRWLADTPVTQALWEAVMGQNPSRFKTPDRPVESVSWKDCQAFCQRLAELGVHLPSESEWEYACRGGTETATWVGDLKILGENNAPVLDPIAWYGGNSGEGFELKEGADSKGWPNKQYQHRKAGSRPVAMKEANPLGLFDTLGNVWEWCADHTEDDMKRADDDVVDPSPATAGLDRVFRGGSWHGLARYVRAASRGMIGPADQGDLLGFRLARGRAPSPGGGAPGAERNSGSGLGGGAPAAERLSGSPAAERLSDPLVGSGPGALGLPEKPKKKRKR